MISKKTIISEIDEIIKTYRTDTEVGLNAIKEAKLIRQFVSNLEKHNDEDLTIGMSFQSLLDVRSDAVKALKNVEQSKLQPCYLIRQRIDDKDAAIIYIKDKSSAPNIISDLMENETLENLCKSKFELILKHFTEEEYSSITFKE